MAMATNTSQVVKFADAFLIAAIVPTLSRQLSWSHFDPASNKIKVMTMKVSKGLEFSVVALPGVRHMPAARVFMWRLRRLRKGCYSESVAPVLLRASFSTKSTRHD
jgi:superfamily I DNA/RNA helicase